MSSKAANFMVVVKMSKSSILVEFSEAVGPLVEPNVNTVSVFVFISSSNEVACSVTESINEDI